MWIQINAIEWKQSITLSIQKMILLIFFIDLILTILANLLPTFIPVHLFSITNKL